MTTPASTPNPAVMTVKVAVTATPVAIPANVPVDATPATIPVAVDASSKPLTAITYSFVYVLGLYLIQRLQKGPKLNRVLCRQENVMHAYKVCI